LPGWGLRIAAGENARPKRRGLLENSSPRLGKRRPGTIAPPAPARADLDAPASSDAGRGRVVSWPGPASCGRDVPALGCLVGHSWVCRWKLPRSTWREGGPSSALSAGTASSSKRCSEGPPRGRETEPKLSAGPFVRAYHFRYGDDFGLVETARPRPSRTNSVSCPDQTCSYAFFWVHVGREARCDGRRGRPENLTPVQDGGLGREQVRPPSGGRGPSTSPRPPARFMYGQCLNAGRTGASPAGICAGFPRSERGFRDRGVGARDRGGGICYRRLRENAQ